MFDIPEELCEYMMQFEKHQMFEIMCEALDQMQAYNGRSLAYCIVSSIPGAECIELDTGGYRYKLPKRETA